MTMSDPVLLESDLCISIIIVNWNTSDLLQQCLLSVYRAGITHSFEVIVVDNGSIDGSGEVVQAQFPTVRLIENKENRGFAAANNQGIAISRGEYIILLNSDTEVHPGAFDNLVDAAFQYPRAGVIGPLLLNPDGSLQHSVYHFVTLLRAVLLGFGIEQVRIGKHIFHASTLCREWSYDTMREVDYVRGACMLIRRVVLEQIGLLDERFFMYGEEADFCYRTREVGWSVLFFPGAAIIHYGGQSARKTAPETAARRTVSVWLFLKKHHGLLYGAVFRVLAIGIALLRMCAYSVIALSGGQGRVQRDASLCKLQALIAGKYPESQ